MKSRGTYAPGPAAGAEVRKDGEKWTLVLVRELDASGPVKLTTVGMPTPQVSETHVTRAEAPRLD